MMQKFLAWWREDDLDKHVRTVIVENAKFIYSLDKRQYDYYLGLHDSWRKEMTRLEKRIYDLENKK